MAHHKQHLPWLNRKAVAVAYQWFTSRAYKHHHSSDCWRLMERVGDNISKLIRILSKTNFMPIGQKSYGFNNELLTSPQLSSLDKIYARLLSEYIKQEFSDKFLFKADDKYVCRHMVHGHKSAVRDCYYHLLKHNFFYKLM